MTLWEVYVGAFITWIFLLSPSSINCSLDLVPIRDSADKYIHVLLQSDSWQNKRNANSEGGVMEVAVPLRRYSRSRRVKRDRRPGLFDRILNVLKSEFVSWASRLFVDTPTNGGLRRRTLFPIINHDDDNEDDESAEDDEIPLKKPKWSRKKIRNREKINLILNNAEQSEVCGRQLVQQHSIQRRITGGTKATFAEWPWQVSLQLRVGPHFQHQCGATLLNKRWGITAAHCVYNIPNHLFVARLGEYDFTSDQEDLGHVERSLSAVIIHPRFDYPSLRNDIALLRFRKVVKFHQHVLPICLPRRYEDFSNKTAYATGWGRMYEGGPVSDVLLKITVPILNKKQCEKMLHFDSIRRSVPDVFLCAGRPEGGVDACEGDSGGPLVSQRDNGRWVLVGITSSGRGPGCGRPNKPGFYTKISMYKDWIDSFLQYD